MRSCGKSCIASDAVGLSNKAAWGGKMMQSKVEKEAKEAIAAIESQHEKELTALVVQMKTNAAELGVSYASCPSCAH